MASSVLKNLFNNNRIVLDPYGLYSTKVKADLRIAHLSDLHEKRFGPHNEELFAQVASIEPDIIAITGDLVAHATQAKADLAYTSELAKGLSAITHSFFVTGNHEVEFADDIITSLTDNGVQVLRGNIATFEVRGTTVNIGGIDDPVFGAPDLAPLLLRFTELNGYNILLSHRPELYPALCGRNLDLVLAGHTHAGQIRLPTISGLYMMGQGFFPKYMEGEFTTGTTTMIISRGLGSSGYPTIRINNPPDLVAIEVRNPGGTQDSEQWEIEQCMS